MDALSREKQFVREKDKMAQCLRYKMKVERRVGKPKEDGRGAKEEGDHAL